MCESALLLFPDFITQSKVQYDLKFLLHRLIGFASQYFDSASLCLYSLLMLLCCLRTEAVYPRLTLVPKCPLRVNVCLLLEQCCSCSIILGSPSFQLFFIFVFI